MKRVCFSVRVLISYILSFSFVSLAMAASFTPRLPEHLLVKNCIQGMHQITGFPGIRDPHNNGAQDLFIVEKIIKEGKKGFAVYNGNRLLFCPDSNDANVYHSDIKGSLAAMETTDEGSMFGYNPSNAGNEAFNMPADGYDIKKKCSDSLEAGSQFVKDVSKRVAESYMESMKWFASESEKKVPKSADFTTLFDRFHTLSACKQLETVASQESELAALAARVDAVKGTQHSIAGGGGSLDN